jgi:hypothetical protein
MAVFQFSLAYLGLQTMKNHSMIAEFYYLIRAREVAK